MSDRRGIAMVMVLVAMLLVGSFAALALHATMIRLRLAGDVRWRTEGALVASSALGSVRIRHRSELDSLADGAVMAFAPVHRSDGWSWRAAARRIGVLIRVEVVAERRASDGTVYAAHRASLLLARDPADTVRVLAHRPRF